MLFTVLTCQLQPRCSLEADDSGKTRIDRIEKIIRECRFGVHDLSRAEVDPNTGLARFNMLLELGLFLGAKAFGGKGHATKTCLILDQERYCFRIFISDLAGQDIRAHGGDAFSTVTETRDWLATHFTGLPGGAKLEPVFRAWQAEREALMHAIGVNTADPPYPDRLELLAQFIVTRA